MLDLILILIFIVELVKPDLQLAKNVKEKASDEQKKILSNNLRKSSCTYTALLMFALHVHQMEILGIILAIVLIILVCKIALPASKENSKIIKEILNQ